MTSKTWLITGASRGFGRVWTEAALERGDRVAATARDVAALAPLSEAWGDAVVPVELDVTDRAAAFAAVARAHSRLGSLDVVVNNAGYGLFGMVEEVTEEQARQQVDTNLLGKAMGVPSQLLSVRQRASTGSSTSGMGSLFDA